MRYGLIVASSLVVSAALYFRQQWDAEDEPLTTWNWFGAAPLSPPPAFRKWFVRWAPFLALVGLLVLGVATFAMR
jgi:hypothetical protein